MTAPGDMAISEPELIVLPDPDAVALAAAERVAAVLAAAVRERGVAHWATTGGSTAPAIYRVLGSPSLREAVPWQRIQLWFGDDRFVERSHPLSNVRPVDDLLLGGGKFSLAIDAVHPFPCSEALGEGPGPEWCAARYAEEVAAAVPADPRSGRPGFDLVLLGVGRDGHILSVFPDSETFEAEALALAVPAPTHVEPHVTRVTLNPAIVDAARAVLVVCHGTSKADAVGAVFGPARDERRWPAQRARRAGAVWLLDEAAAGLPRPVDLALG